MSYTGPPEIEPSQIRYNPVRDELGSGKFGTVYAGKLHSCDVAVKVPKKQDLTQRDLDKFRREVDIMSRINHPNVCLFMGACTRPGEISIVSERLSGDVEHKLRSSEALSLSRRIRWALDAARGLAWLHGREPSVLHRDLKTSNLLLTSNDVVKVCDFGLSQFQAEGGTMRDSTPKGTPLYMAPEVIMRGEITPKVDVYAFGIVLWEILTRTEAFPHHNDLHRFATAICRRHERPPIPQGTPDSLARLMSECWDRKPDVRPHFEEIVERLEGILVECEELEARKKVERAVTDENGAFLWLTCFMRREAVPWPEFAAAFCDMMHIRVSDAELHLQDCPQWLLALHALLVDGGSDEVKLEQWGKICGCFGPLESPSEQDGFIDRITFTLSQQWFHGPLTTEDANKLLGSCVPGSYLFRFSSRSKCFALSVVAENGNVTHYLISRTESGLELEGRYFDSLQVIETTQTTRYFLRDPVPCARYQWIFCGGAGGGGGYVNDGYANRAGAAGASHTSSGRMDVAE